MSIGIQVSTWWKICKCKPFLFKKCKILLSLITGGLSINGQKGHYKANTRLCQLCDRYQEETPTHFLFTCSGLKQERTILLEKVFSTMPHGMRDSVILMVEDELTSFLLGTIANAYVPEWFEIYVAIIHLVAGLYSARDAILWIIPDHDPIPAY